MNRFSTYKEFYFYELSRKESIKSNLTIPIGVLAIVGGVLSLYLKGLFSAEDFDIWFILLMISSAMSILCFMHSTYWLIRSYYNYTYEYVPYMSSLEEYYVGVIDCGYDNSEAENDLCKHMIIKLVNAHRVNVDNNDRRSSHIHTSNKYIIYLIVATFMASVPYYVVNRRSDTKVHHVRLVGSRADSAALVRETPLP